MVAAAALLHHKPILKFTSSRYSNIDSLRPTSQLRLPASGSVFFGGFGLNIAGSKTMTELVITSAFGRGDGEENVKMLQQDSFVRDSSGFASQLFGQGFEPLLNRLSKWLVAALFAAVLVWRHDAEAMWIAMGSVLNALLSVALKQIFNQERPSATSKSDPGMPSSHAQCIFYTVVFCSLSVTEWLGVNELSLFISALNFALGSYFSWLRVSQRYHTASQVVVGAAVGSLFSFLWYWLWQTTVLLAFDSSLFVRIGVVASSFVFCFGFLLYVIRHWLKDED
ncbi:lipid phosphate phosphatase epsilon 2, chloroplastic [Mercurialis annua]|uniref:lipid phosphate phosphatase epsilon 2, chloroplastic n=1 Tax=Mercurialis annua TaxID=3986 RepID=UPI0021603912|nr:lipid phosphate phosphatase epsilon 2, chloroplastic [Mercurialis annua]